MSEWIDATRRSPSDSTEDVLVLYWEDLKDIVRSGVVGYFEDGRWKCSWDGNHIEIDGRRVTYWTRLPDPPCS